MISERRITEDLFDDRARRIESSEEVVSTKK